MFRKTSQLFLPLICGSIICCLITGCATRPTEAGGTASQISHKLKSLLQCKDITEIFDDIYNFNTSTGFNCYNLGTSISFFREYNNKVDMQSALADWSAPTGDRQFVIGDNWFFLGDDKQVAQIIREIYKSENLTQEEKSTFRSNDSNLDWCVRFLSSQVIDNLGNSASHFSTSEIDKINNIYPGSKNVLEKIINQINSNLDNIQMLDDISKEALVSQYISPVKQLCDSVVKD